MIPHVHPEGEPTPTVAELYERRDGSAEVAKWTEGSKTEPPKPAIYRLTDKGYAILGEIMRRNAAASIARGTANWEANESLRRANLTDEQKAAKATKGKGKSNGRKGAWTPS